MSSDEVRPARAPRTSKQSEPTYRRLKRTNGRHLAFVDLDGRRIYLGEWNSPASRQAYQRLLIERRRGVFMHAAVGDGVYVSELLAAYLDHARTYYRDADGNPTRECANIAPLLRMLIELYGDQPASRFDARALKNVRQALIEKGYARGTINRLVVRLRSIFKWAVSEGLIDPQRGSAAVPLHVALELLESECSARRRRGRVTALRMPVPEAAMDEDHGAQTGKHQIRTARKSPRLQSEPVPESVDERPHRALRRRVLAADAGHQGRPLGGRKDVPAGRATSAGSAVGHGRETMRAGPALSDSSNRCSSSRIRLRYAPTTRRVHLETPVPRLGWNGPGTVRGHRRSRTRPFEDRTVSCAALRGGSDGTLRTRSKVPRGDARERCASSRDRRCSTLG